MIKVVKVYKTRSIHRLNLWFTVVASGNVIQYHCIKPDIECNNLSNLFYFRKCPILVLHGKYNVKI